VTAENGNRFLCDSLWSFVPSVLRFSEFNRGNAEFSVLLAVEKVARHGFFVGGSATL